MLVNPGTEYVGLRQGCRRKRRLGPLPGGRWGGAYKLAQKYDSDRKVGRWAGRRQGFPQKLYVCHIPVCVSSFLTQREFRSDRRRVFGLSVLQQYFSEQSR